VTRSIYSLLALLVCTASFLAFAQDKKPDPAKAARLKPGEFPAAGSGKYLSGELVVIDPVNRRGGIRLDGDEGGRYHAGPLHYFAMLPCGMARLHGAPAELRDIPLGTHVHGYFHLPPAGEEKTIPKQSEKHEIAENHALSIEDDFSYYQRRGQSWKVVAIDLKKGKLDVAPDGKTVKDGISGKHTFDIDNVTRVWKGRTLVDLDEVAAGAIVQLNLAWCQGSEHKEFSVSDLWLDEAARKHATEQQRRRHVRYQRQRWVPAVIDHVELFDFGGAVITVTLFGGMDRSLYDDMKATRETGFWVAAADRTLRTWFHRADRKVGKVLEWKESADPPPGSSGIQVRMRFAEVLEGYRPGRCVRIKCDRWAFVTMPPEERLKSPDDLKRAATLTLP